MVSRQRAVRISFTTLILSGSIITNLVMLVEGCTFHQRTFFQSRTARAIATPHPTKPRATMFLQKTWMR